MARPVTSSKTRYGALSSVPSAFQLLVPTGRTAKLTWAKAFSVKAAEISARPPTTAPGCGEVIQVVGADSRSGRCAWAFHTDTDSAGTVAVTRVSLPDLTSVWPP